MSSLINCKRCGKIFSYTGKSLCPACMEKEDADFENVREFIKENPGKNLQEVSDETGVSVKMITKFLREGKIEFADGSGTYLTCGGCGAPISTGRYCNACLSRLGKELMDSTPKKKPVQEEAPKKGKDKMHISKLRKG